MHTIKITPNLLFVYKRQIYQIAESNRIESKFFWPELECSTVDEHVTDAAAAATALVISHVGAGESFVRVGQCRLVMKNCSVLLVVVSILVRRKYRLRSEFLYRRIE